MQLFKSTSSGAIYAYEDYLTVAIDAAGVSSVKVGSRVIPSPSDLEPYTPAAPTSAELLATAQATQLDLLSSACANTIVSGFTSSALGAAYTYPSKPTDQTNLIGAVTTGVAGNFWCADATGAWALRMHTAAQFKQVLVDGATARESYSLKLDTLSTQVRVAATIADVEAIVW